MVVYGEWWGMEPKRTVKPLHQSELRMFMQSWTTFLLLQKMPQAARALRAERYHNREPRSRFVSTLLLACLEVFGKHVLWSLETCPDEQQS